MQDWMKKKGLPLFIGIVALHMLRSDVNFYLNSEYYGFGQVISSIFLGIMLLVVAIATYFEMNGKAVLGQVLYIISGVVALISWSIIVIRYGAMIDTFDIVITLVLSVVFILAGIIKLVRLEKGESIYFKTSKRTQIIGAAVTVFLMIVFMYAVLLGFGINR